MTKTGSQSGARPARSDAAVLTPFELAEKWYPGGGPPRPAGSVHDYVAAQLVHVLTWRLLATGREDFTVFREVNLYLRRGCVAVPDVALYLRIPLSKPPGAGAYVVPRDGAPALAMEILTRVTWQKDVPHADDEAILANKKDFYQACGVAEYWIYDPETCREDRAVRLEGFRLQPDGCYAEIAPDRQGHWHSEVLATVWGIGGPQFLGADRYVPIRLLNPQTGEWYPTTAERDRQFEEKGRQIEELKALLAQSKKQ